MARSTASRYFIRLILLFPLGLIVAGDVALGMTILRQLRAESFPTTEGRITKSHLKEMRGAKNSRTHILELEYSYRVAGQAFTGTRIHYAAIATNSNLWKRLQAEYPVGGTVEVYYDPDDPSESLLKPGLIGVHLFAVWFLALFNIVVFGAWLAIGARPEFSESDPRIVAPSDRGWTVRLPSVSPLGVFAIVLLVLTFIGIFVWAFAYGFDPPPWLIGSAALGCVVLALLATLRTPPPNMLEIDEMEKTLRLPGASGETRTLPLASIRTIDVTAHRPPGKKGTRHLCRFHFADSEPMDAVTYYDRDSAEGFARWLSERLGLK